MIDDLLLRFGRVAGGILWQDKSEDPPFVVGLDGHLVDVEDFPGLRILLKCEGYSMGSRTKGARGLGRVRLINDPPWRSAALREFRFEFGVGRHSHGT